MCVPCPVATESVFDHGFVDSPTPDPGAVDNFPGLSDDVPTLLRMDENRAVNPSSWGAIELDTELTEWLKRLPARHLATVAFYLDLLARHGPQLGWPHVRQTDAKLRKLRFHLDGRAVRIIYWIAPGQRIVLLTVFMKGRTREQHEVGRARRALKRYQSGRRGAPADIPRSVREVQGNG